MLWFEFLVKTNPFKGFALLVLMIYEKWFGLIQDVGGPDICNCKIRITSYIWTNSYKLTWSLQHLLPYFNTRHYSKVCKTDLSEIWDLIIKLEYLNNEVYIRTNGFVPYQKIRNIIRKGGYSWQYVTKWMWEMYFFVNRVV